MKWPRISEVDVDVAIAYVCVAAIVAFVIRFYY